MYKVEWSNSDPNRVFFLYWPDKKGNAFTKSPLDLHFGLSDNLLVSFSDLFSNAVDFLLKVKKRCQFHELSFIECHTTLTKASDADAPYESLWVGVVRDSQTLVLDLSTDSGNTFLRCSLPSDTSFPQVFFLLLNGREKTMKKRQVALHLSDVCLKSSALKLQC